MKRTPESLYAQAGVDADQDIIAHMGLVRRVALHLQARVPRYMRLDDLIQAGMIGLIEAKNAFDPGKASGFEAYAYIRVKGAMLDEVRRMSSSPRSAVALSKSHAQSAHQLAGKLGRAPTQAELAEFMGKDLDSLQFERAQAIQFETTSIETLPESVENISADQTWQPDVRAEKAQFMEALTEAIEGLPEREKLVISLYYVEEMNLKEIGAVLGVTQSRVSQMLSATAKALRKTLQVEAN